MDSCQKHRLGLLQVREECLASPLVFAPMSGVSNLPARLLAHEAGAGAVFTETVSARALVEGRPGALRKLHSHPLEGRLAVQLFGAERHFLGEAAARLSASGIDWVDLNLGCPVKKFQRAGAGATLLREPRKIAPLLAAIRSASPGVFSIKIRLGWDASQRVGPEVARIAAAEGVDLVSVHGRTRAQQYRGSVDRDAIAEVVDAVPALPVLANGDIRTPDDVFSMLRDTGAAGVMIGRAAVGNPWIFARTRAAAAGTPDAPPSRHARLETLERHVEWIARSVEDPAARTAQVRRYVAAYSKGLAGSGRFREHALSEEDPDRIVSLARDFLRPSEAADASQTIRPNRIDDRTGSRAANQAA